jgi:hypothetical protein
MSRSGYTEDCDYDQWRHIMWRGAVTSSVRGKRGQAFLRDLIGALDAMPEKRLITEKLVQDGAVCAIGSLGVQRGIQMETLDPDEPDQIAEAFDIASPLVREIVWMNDEAGGWNETPEQRWSRMRAWAESHLKAAT